MEESIMQLWKYFELHVRNATIEDGKILPLSTPVIIATNGEDIDPIPLVTGLNVLGETGWELVGAMPELQRDGITMLSRFYLKQYVELGAGDQLGTVVHFYDRISVAVIKLQHSIVLGDKVRFHGKKTDFTQEVTSLQIDRQPVETARFGQEVAMKVDQQVQKGDMLLLEEV
jgi:hypothetical protein